MPFTRHANVSDPARVPVTVHSFGAIDPIALRVNATMRSRSPSGKAASQGRKSNLRRTSSRRTCGGVRRLNAVVPWMSAELTGRPVSSANAKTTRSVRPVATVRSSLESGRFRGVRFEGVRVGLGKLLLVSCGRHTQWYRRGLLTVSRPKTVRTGACDCPCCNAARRTQDKSA